MSNLKHTLLIGFAALSFSNLPVFATADNAVQQDGQLPDQQNWDFHSIWDAPPGCYFAKDKSGNALWMFFIPGQPYSASSQPCVVFPKDLEKMIGTKDYLDLLYGPAKEEVVKQPPAITPPKLTKKQRLFNHLNAFSQSLTPAPGSYSTFSGFTYPSGFLQGGVIQQPQFMQGTINY